MMLNRDSILYYGNEGPAPRPDTALFFIMDFDSKNYWYIDFFHGHHLYDVTFTEDILTRIRSGETTLLLNNSHEAFYDVVEPIYEHFVLKMNIPAQHITLLTEAANIKEYVETVAIKYNNIPFNVCWLRIFEYNVKNMLTEMTVPNTLEIKHYDKKFINLNRRWRLHRPVFVGLLNLHDLLDYGYVSFAQNVDKHNWKRVWSHIEIELRNSELLELFQNNKDRLTSMPDLYLDTKELHVNQVNINDDLNYYYENTYFSLVNETNFYKTTGEGVFLSEKVFKPIAKMHPFIIISRPHSLAYLRQLGYRTFDGLINEDYDTETDDNKRMMMIIEETKRLSNLSGSDLEHYLRECKTICEHNYDILQNQTSFIKNF